MEASYAATGEQAREEILAMIPDHSSVYLGDSRTVAEIGLWQSLAEHQRIRLIDSFQPGLTPEERYEKRLRGMSADFFITGSNALTMQGQIVNLDGMGNRVSAMCFGPKKVVLVIGMNKVVPDLETAVKRIRQAAAPMNAIRLQRRTPCV